MPKAWAPVPTSSLAKQGGRCNRHYLAAPSDRYRIANENCKTEQMHGHELFFQPADEHAEESDLLMHREPTLVR